MGAKDFEITALVYGLIVLSILLVVRLAIEEITKVAIVAMNSIKVVKNHAMKLRGGRGNV